MQMDVSDSSLAEKRTVFLLPDEEKGVDKLVVPFHHKMKMRSRGAPRGSQVPDYVLFPHQVALLHEYPV